MSADSDDTRHEVVEPTGDGATEEHISAAVVAAVARASGTDPTELPPLYNYVNLEALEELITHGATHPDHDAPTVTFPFDDYEVTVHGDREVVVTKSLETA